MMMMMSSKLRNVTCRMGSHNVTFHPTQVNTSQSVASTWTTYLPCRDRRL